MTGHPTRVRNQYEALQIETAVGAILDDRLPIRAICPGCRALIAAGMCCPICVEIRRRQYERLHKTA